MDLNVDVAAFEEETTELSTAIIGVEYLEEVEAPDTDKLRGSSIEAYINEAIAARETMFNYGWLLTEDLLLIKEMVAKFAAVDSDMSTKVNGES